MIKGFKHRIIFNHITVELRVGFGEKNWLPKRTVMLSKYTDDNMIVTMKHRC